MSNKIIIIIITYMKQAQKRNSDGRIPNAKHREREQKKRQGRAKPARRESNQKWPEDHGKTRKGKEGRRWRWCWLNIISNFNMY